MYVATRYVYAGNINFLILKRGAGHDLPFTACSRLVLLARDFIHKKLADLGCSGASGFPYTFFPTMIGFVTLGHLIIQGIM